MLRPFNHRSLSLRNNSKRSHHSTLQCHTFILPTIPWPPTFPGRDRPHKILSSRHSPHHPASRVMAWYTTTPNPPCTIRPSNPRPQTRQPNNPTNPRRPGAHHSRKKRRIRADSRITIIIPARWPECQMPNEQHKWACFILLIRGRKHPPRAHTPLHYFESSFSAFACVLSPTCYIIRVFTRAPAVVRGGEGPHLVLGLSRFWSMDLPSC
jgi:hypothetical protein